MCERVLYMEYIRIIGGRKLKGEITVQGAKNSALPILAATLLCKGKCEIHNCPQISDVDAALNILKHLGCSIYKDGNIVLVDPSKINCDEIPDELMRKMRSSIVFLGAIISRCGNVVLSFPGGCELGPRPIDIHLSSLKQLGVKIEESEGKLYCYTEDCLKGCEIYLPIPSVGATENIILAATKAKGTTIIRNAAREPEIVDLANFINSAGGKIFGAGEGTITIEGVDKLHETVHTVIPDRIVTATYMSAAAVTEGNIKLKNVNPHHLYSVFPAYAEAGCELEIDNNNITIKGPKILKPINLLRTGVYPGFPTDAQPTLMAMTAFANGTSVFVENIFENRYKHVGEMARMAAKIKVEGKVAVVEGNPNLNGARVEAGDLRGGAALTVAGLGCRGMTGVYGVSHIKRGYEDIVGNLKSVNADISLVTI